MTTSVIRAEGLVKRFGTARALDGLDLDVHPGEVHGFLGPNGAGKTTTIRVLLGLLRHDGGHVELLGGDPWREATELHRRLVYVPGDVTLWPTLTGGEVIDLLGRQRGGLDEGRRDHYIELFDLDPKKKCRTYSKGNRQKVALISALASDAELLILDEPTSGLDPLMESTFAGAVQQEKEKGRTVLLSSHILSEVEALCERVTIIKDGRTVESSTLAALRSTGRTAVTAELDSVPDRLDEVPGVTHLRVEDATIRCQVRTGQMEALMKELIAAGLRSLQCQPPSLDELFLSHYRRDVPEQQETAQQEHEQTGGRH